MCVCACVIYVTQLARHPPRPPFRLFLSAPALPPPPEVTPVPTPRGRCGWPGSSHLDDPGSIGPAVNRDVTGTSVLEERKGSATEQTSRPWFCFQDDSCKIPALQPASRDRVLADGRRAPPNPGALPAARAARLSLTRRLPQACESFYKPPTHSLSTVFSLPVPRDIPPGSCLSRVLVKVYSQ